jgi:hypothetical protein
MPNSPTTLADLLIQEDQDSILDAALTLCRKVKLPVDSWQASDPTRATLTFEAEYLAKLDAFITGFAASGTLDAAAQAAVSEWLIILAKEGFNVNVPSATFATTSVTFTNTEGGVFDFEPGDIVVKNAVSGATYTSTTGGILGSAGTATDVLTIDVSADQVGTAGNANAGDLSELVTTYLGVTCTNAAPAVGTDAPNASAIVQMCRDKTASLSACGPDDAYRYVALNSALTGILTPTRARVYGDSDTGQVTVYLAGSGGALSGGDVAAVTAAIKRWAAPLCITPTVSSANPVTVFVNYQIWIYESVGQDTAEIETAVDAMLTAVFALLPIGGNITPPAATGFLYTSLILATIGATFPGKIFQVALTLPSADVALENGDVPVLSISGRTVTLVPDP